MTNYLSVVLQQNEWRSYRGPSRTFVCTREIIGAESEKVLTFQLSDFASPDGPPTSWAELDQLGLCAHFVNPGSTAGKVPLWNGPGPQFLRLEWARNDP